MEFYHPSQIIETDFVIFLQKSVLPQEVSQLALDAVTQAQARWQPSGSSIGQLSLNVEFCFLQLNQEEDILHHRQRKTLALTTTIVT